ncbi:ABC transporter permease, partial [Acinetobacter baumannii]|nr:ABC transporter permease [Acinetobacter baumannii]
STDTGTKTKTTALSVADAEALLDPAAAPDVLAVAPVVSASSVVATYSGASHTVTTTTGSTSAYLTINNDTVSSGRTFTDSDESSRARVVLVGTTVAEDLAGGDGSGVLDQVVQLNGSSFTVVGILTTKGSTG